MMVVDYHPMNYWDQIYYQSASIQSLVNLGKRKGCELLYQMTEGANLFFVLEEYFPAFGIEDNSPEKIYQTLHPIFTERPNVKWGRNGVPRPKGKETLNWDRLVIEKKFLFHR